MTMIFKSLPIATTNVFIYLCEKKCYILFVTAKILQKFVKKKKIRTFPFKIGRIGISSTFSVKAQLSVYAPRHAPRSVIGWLSTTDRPLKFGLIRVYNLCIFH